MSAPKHAPGPWTAQGLAIVASDRSFVGRVYPWCADPQDAECAKANARLIAAAPELLATLEDVLWCIDHGPSCQIGVVERCQCSMCVAGRIRATIAKAKGEA